MVRAALVRDCVWMVLALAIAGCGQPAGPRARTTATVEKAEAAPEALPAASSRVQALRDEADAMAGLAPASPRSLRLEWEAPQEGRGPGNGGDKYALIEEPEFVAVHDAPLSTFSIDVDTASYAKTRAYLLEHRTLPPPDAVRIEELINYFDYAYAGPEDEHPFAVHLETAQCPWQPRHRLVRIGIQGRRIEQERPTSNLVFLIDVSGSMAPANKLPLVQRGLSLLVKQLGENDRVAIVVYAGAAGLVLPPTRGSEQASILQAIERLEAGGSTNGGQGIELAYRLASENFVKGGVNRVLLCTDGDFNVGTTSTSDLVRLAQDKARAGVYLSVLGFGFGNHNDALLEQIAGKANGNYAFIDSLAEAKKVLVEQMQGTLVTIAKDVKLQVEFNPATVGAYRLIGYENRRLADRDFNDDTKDAGDIGAGHSVTALYEIVPPGTAMEAVAGVDPLKYRQDKDRERITGNERVEYAKELLTLKLRYQPPEGGKSTLLTFPLRNAEATFTSASPDLQFAAAVASFGMLLRNSKHKGDASYAAVMEIASGARGEDRSGRRSEFLQLVKTAGELSGERVGLAPIGWQPARHFAMPLGAPRAAASTWLGFLVGAAAGTALLLAIALALILASWATIRTVSFACRRATKPAPGGI